ncbi:hypothetical protein R80B4_02216 [Fibrobacteres bacterium R8-0-B4]
MSIMARHGRALLLAAVLAAVGAHTVLAQQQQNFTGKGGKGISLTIYVPQSTGLEEGQSYIPALVQGEFVSNFSNYSAISILDWERLDDIYVKLVNDAYDDNAAAKQDVVLGRMAPTTHFLTGNITKTEAGYNIKMNITKTADKMTVATYSGMFTIAELNNLTGIRRASLELLQKVGVELTEKARQELAGAAAANQVSAQTALAKGVTAQRAGTEVAALSYYYQAASFDPALKEAVKRSSVVSANISSGNIGADIRNDILWRKKWAAKLEETEKTFYELIKVEAAAPPYSLTYITDIKTGEVNYQTETADLSITTALVANSAWFNAMQRALGAAQAVLNGLNSTGRKDAWGWGQWPKVGLTDTNPFNRSKEYDIKAVFELVNQQGRVIGSQTLGLNPKFNIDGTNVALKWLYVNTVTFNGVRANDISDKLTIRVASVNGAPPQSVRFSITAAPLIEKTQPLIDNRDGKQYNTVKIAGKRWMAQNLEYKTKSKTDNLWSWCYENDNSYCGKYGRFYDWNTAMVVCPAGWHLPSNSEWAYLVGLSGGDMAGKKLKSTYGWANKGNGTDEYGFSALPFGGRYPGNNFKFASYQGIWWTATNNGRDKAYYRNMHSNDDDVGERYDDKKENGFSVRCVAD